MIGKTRQVDGVEYSGASASASLPGTQPQSEVRGVLRPTLTQGTFQHQRQLPSPTLAEWVEHYWYVSWDLRGLPAQQQATLPHPNLHLVIEHGQARIYGVHSERFMRQLEGQDQVFGIKFKAGGFYPFYRQPVALLGNQSIDATACFGNASADLTQQVLASTNFASMCNAADAFLLLYLPPIDTQVARVSSLLSRIERERDIIAVEDVLAISGLDKRALQRLFQKYVGIGPKWVIKRYRLHEAIAQVQAGKELSWTALALELGYFDQAHFVRDFRQSIGMTPGEYEKSLAS